MSPRRRKGVRDTGWSHATGGHDDLWDSDLRHIPGEVAAVVQVVEVPACLMDVPDSPSRRIAAEQYRVGFQFTDIKPDMEAVLGAFVDGR